VEFRDGYDHLKSGQLSFKDGFQKACKPQTDIATGKFQSCEISLKAGTPQKKFRPSVPNA
jgi:hypothetical protein